MMSAIKIHTATLMLDTRSTLGEGPVWDWQRQWLFWVDIEGKKLHRHELLTKKNTEWSFDEMLGAAVPMKNGQLLLALESGLASFDCESEKLIKLAVLENTNTNLRFNDGKVDPMGNFWIGTMHKEAASKAGDLYCVNPDLKSSLVIHNTSISNGMAWSSGNKTFYYIDSPTFEVRAFDFDAENSSISNGKAVIEVPKEYGSPDGMSIDSEGMLWVAHWGGHCVRRWNPETGKVLEKVEVDAPHVTSCCFGGADLKTLYITTARSGLTEAQLKQYPKSGGVFIHKTEVKGTPINYFKYC